MNPKRQSFWWALACVGMVLVAALLVARITGAHFLQHSDFDSYSYQAMAWRGGNLSLPENRPWLELAFFQGRVYLSFPPVPTVPMWVLTFFFGEKTPSGLMTLVYFLGIALASFWFLKRRLPLGAAAGVAAFTVLAGSMLDLAVSNGTFSGAVWYQAQLLGALCTLLSFLWVTSEDERLHGWGLAAIALAVGCRPFNAVYVPLLLLILVQKRGLKRLWALLIVPCWIALAYAALNMARFQNPIEFGHTYLPELTDSGETMFALRYLLPNIGSILRLPVFREGVLVTVVGGFAVYVTNPMLFIAPISALRKPFEWVDGALILTMLLHAVLLLMHRTQGGWQYGTRYLTDVVPAAVWLFQRKTMRIPWWLAMGMGMLVVLNIVGTVLFHAG